MTDTHPNTYAMNPGAKAKIEQVDEIIRLINRIAALEAQNKKLVEALTGIIEIGKRDMTNEKYDIYFDTARALLAEVTQ